jgi:hypothetical protein
MNKQRSHVQPTEYSGKMRDYQLFGNGKKQFVDYERDEFNAYQNFLYKRALFGLSVYSAEELSVMHWDKKRRIQKVHSRTQVILNVWKQQIVSDTINNLLSRLFYNSPMVKDLVNNVGDVTDPTYISTIQFKDLGVKKQDIVAKLIEEKVLPSNFYDLT